MSHGVLVAYHGQSVHSVMDPFFIDDVNRWRKHALSIQQKKLYKPCAPLLLQVATSRIGNIVLFLPICMHVVNRVDTHTRRL